MTDKVRGSRVRGLRKVRATADEPQFGSEAPGVIVGELGEPLPKRALRGTLTLVLLALSGAFLLYLVLASTVLGVFAAGDSRAVVLRAAFPQGAAPPGTQAYASSGQAPRDAAGKIEQAFLGVPNGSVIEIVARPGRKVSNAPDGQILVDGKPSGHVAKIKPRVLIRQYLAVCVSGACGSPGDPVLVPQDNLIGSVKAYVGMFWVKAAARGGA